MEDIKIEDDLYKYFEEYFKNNEEYFLRPNHRAPDFPDLLNRLRSTSLKKRLEWVINSTFKTRYGDPVQTSLFNSFNEKELGEILLTYDFEDIKKVKEGRLFEKMPQETMQKLFLLDEVVKGLDLYFIEMLTKEYAIYNERSIPDYIRNNDEKLEDSVMYELYKRILDPKLSEEIKEENFDFFQDYLNRRAAKGR